MQYLPYDKRAPDTQYRELLKRILDEGRKVMPIHGEHARMVVGHQMRFDMKNGFPLITERDLTNLLKGAIGELVAFLHGARTLDELVSYDCPKAFWERWVTKEKCDIFGLPEGDLGDGSYGAAWASFPTNEGKPFNQVEHLMKQIKERPFLRTHILSPWIPFFTLQHSELTRKVVVAPCHGWVHILAFPETKELSLHHFQRSADVPVGVAFNLIEYAALGMLIARTIGYEFVEYVHTFSDAHIYESQIPFVEEILSREPRTLPTVTLDKSITDIFDARPEHFSLSDYNPHEKMKIPTPV
jgi:thymidylate synthase